eukprot:2872719-Amphidinium_carterae.1
MQHRRFTCKPRWQVVLSSELACETHCEYLAAHSYPMTSEALSHSESRLCWESVEEVAQIDIAESKHPENEGTSSAKVPLQRMHVEFMLLHTVRPHMRTSLAKCSSMYWVPQMP